jgi:AcrR family transcriptional regulator
VSRAPKIWHAVVVPRLTPERRRELARDAMLDAAETVFAKKGFGGASMEEIAAEAGFSRAALYARFGNKEDLLGTVLDRHSERAVEAFSAMEVPSTPLEGAFAAAEIFLQRTTLEMVPLDLELRLNALRNPNLRRRVVEADRSLAEKMAQLIEHNMKGARHHLDIPAEDLADIGNAAVAGLMQFAALDEVTAERFERLVESLFVLLTSPYSNTKDIRKVRCSTPREGIEHRR